MQHWPSYVWIVRHGESAGNVARDAAMSAGLARIDIPERDVDVPLSALGERQSLALGRWFASMPVTQRPQIVLSSPYVRAGNTARLLANELKLTGAPDVIFDERLREKEFGVLDRLTKQGIEQLHPEQAEFRRLLGKFYHRPPAGESWCDVILRLRSAIDTVSLHYAGKRVVIVTHQVVVLCLRYLFENLTEQQILEIDARGDVANCAVTDYALDPDRGPTGMLVLKRYNFIAPVEREGTPVTSEPDANVAAR